MQVGVRSSSKIICLQENNYCLHCSVGSLNAKYAAICVAINLLQALDFTEICMNKERLMLLVCFDFANILGLWHEWLKAN